MKSKTHILRIDASANVTSANSKKLGDSLIEQLKASYGEITVHHRDLNQGLQFIDESWVGANFTPAENRDQAQQQHLAFSDVLIDEIKQADHIVLTTPMYNFGIPATLKSWIDLICRAGVTFQYTADGPVGLIGEKPLDIVITTGGVPLQSPADFVTGYLKQVFGFIGISKINIIAADQMNVNADDSFQAALHQIENNHGDSHVAA
jgi:FMN-dependent NADH-azoreductase